MKSLLNIQIMLSFHLLVVVIVVVIGSWAISNSKAELRTELQSNIDRQLVLLDKLAIITDRNGADEVVSEIITDCPNRPQFENILSKLATLKYKNLITAQQLFESCGSFYAERKAVMVSRMEREYEVLVDNIKLLNTLDTNNDSFYDRLSIDWSSIVEMENERSALLSEQVIIQRNIITELIAGESVLSTAVSVEVARAQDVTELLIVLDSKIDVLREEIIER